MDQFVNLATPMIMNSYYGGLWGEASAYSYGGMNSDTILMALAAPNASGGLPMINHHWPSGVGSISKWVKDNIRSTIGPTYEDWLGPRAAGSKIWKIPGSGMNSGSEHRRLEDNREIYRRFNNIRQNPDLILSSSRDELNNRTTHTITNGKTGGSLNVTVQGTSLTETAMQIIIEALRAEFNKHGDLFQEININPETFNRK